MATKVKIRINSNDKIEELLQETYNQACEQITQVQEEMNKITQSTSLADLTVDEKAKYAKIMHDYSGDKDRAIRAKMDIAKLLIEIVNHKGNGAIPHALGNFLQHRGKSIRNVIGGNKDKVINRHQRNASQTIEVILLELLSAGFSP